MIEHEIVMRWGDIDSYGHVNNVRYVDYAAEGRQRLVRDGLLPADQRIAAINVDYLVPLVLSERPVIVSSTLKDNLLTQEVCVDTDAGRVICSRQVTQFGGSQKVAPVSDVAGVVQQPVPVRLHDLGPDGVVTPERAADLVQELRIAHRYGADPDRAWGKTVVAAVRIDFHGTVRYGAPELLARCWTSRLGTSSFVAESEVRDGADVLLRARSVMVAWNPQTERSRPMSDQERAVFVVSAPERAGVAAPRR